MSSPELLTAIQKGNLEQVKELLEKAKLDPNDSDSGDGWNALHWACNYGHLSIIEFLLPRMRDLNAKTRFHYTPVYLAASNNHPLACSLLLNTGRNIETGEALVYARKRGFTEVIDTIENFTPSVKHEEQHQHQNQPTVCTDEQSQKIISELQEKVINLEATVKLLQHQLQEAQNDASRKNRALEQVEKQMLLIVPFLQQARGKASQQGGVL